MLTAVRAVLPACVSWCLGLANAKTVTIEADGEAVKFAVGRVKKAQSPKSAKAV